ncbi:hypothetical protein D3C87_80530 [compost metagenome]
MENIDLRNLQVDVVKNGNFETIKINTNDGKNLGYFEYKIYSYEDDEEKYLYITNILVYPQYQNLGIGQLLYKEFGKIYNEKFSGFELKRDFINPIAEYAYRKAIGLGWIPESTLIEEKVRRSYNDADQDLVTDLRNKLPENVRGPEVWAKIN